MSFRKEKKFRLTKSDLCILKRSLVNKGMKILYPRRTINSYYLDTKNLKMFFESEEGILPRKKIRYRWYEDNKSTVNKEVKISSEEGRFKIISKMNINFLNNLSNLSSFDQNYGMIFPTLHISYLREYYTFKDLRLTFDTNIKYIDLIGSISHQLFDNENVMEIKSPINISDYYIDKLIDMQPSRFSKYCRGLLSFKKNL